MKKWQKVVIIIILIIIFLQLLLIFSNNNSNSETKIVKNTNDNNVVIVGNMIQNINLSYKRIKSNDSYSFKVLNYNSKKINNKDIVYNISVNKVKGIEFELYKDNKKIDFKNNKTEDIVLEKNKKSIENYRIKLIKKDFEKIQILI